MSIEIMQRSEDGLKATTREIVKRYGHCRSFYRSKVAGLFRNHLSAYAERLQWMRKGGGYHH